MAPLLRHASTTVGEDSHTGSTHPTGVGDVESHLDFPHTCLVGLQAPCDECSPHWIGFSATLPEERNSHQGTKIAGLWIHLTSDLLRAQEMRPGWRSLGMLTFCFTEHWGPVTVGDGREVWACAHVSPHPFYTGFHVGAICRHKVSEDLCGVPAW